jgi:tellurite methyltransferase
MSERRSSMEWRAYYSATADRPTRATLLFALDRFEQERRNEAPGRPDLAIDLGCGNGNDTAELLRRGWRVLAIDAEPAAIEGLLQNKASLAPNHLETRVARFEEFDLPPAQLINSSFALPLCPPDAFHRLWARIVAALEPGGRFAGQFFGDRDSWANPGSGKAGMTFLTREAAQALLQDLEIELFEEEENDSVTRRGSSKHWHVFHIVARKPDHAHSP